jgi:DNA-binding NarL/FixJ family response regulator
MIRVLIVDDQKTEREGFSLLLRREPDLEVIGVARDGLEAVECTSVGRLDVVTMDVQMPRLNGLEATRRILTQDGPPRVLVVAMTWSDDLVQQALDCGAHGYVAKLDAFRELPSAVRAVNGGSFYFSDTLDHWRSLEWLKRQN